MRAQGRWRRAAGAGGLVLLLTVACGACAGGGARGVPAPAPATQPTTKAQQCAGQVAYWANAILKATDDAGFDYQEMGLADAEYEMVLAIVKPAKPMLVQKGQAATAAFVAAQARQRCEARYRAPARGGSTGTTHWPAG